MSASLYPSSEAEIADIVSEAGAKNSPLRIIGGGTREGLGRPVEAEKTLSLAKHSGISLYEPGALTIVARAGTPIAEIEKILAGENQRLAFEPMDHRPLFGSKGTPTIGGPTIGGIVGGNISGPRRIIGGACRDSLIGVRFINGDGAIIKNGGRVMKNVTGLDLVKLMAGSYGTLGVMSEVSFKVLPANERQATLAILGLDLETGIKVLSSALGSPFEVTGAAFLPEGEDDMSRTLLRVEGFDTQVAYRLDRLKELCAKSINGSKSEMQIVKGKQHNDLWREIRDVKIFQGTDDLVLKLHIKPGDAPAISSAVSTAINEKTGVRMINKMLFDWGGGLIWTSVNAPENISVIRSIVKDFGGHVMLVRAPAKIREQISPFHPEHDRIVAISECIRQKFDPKGILNPYKMIAAAERGK
ncbi:Glycolate dehydrogenase, FAD-binding subunit GlcE [hydrothermal vent metagenome]|uniref:Glycolate dehydrogenase, FAD-binding subunit GlcE n=1 Tax=hydrothermal vent metagenome TaxID=652676 RepID=A0A3B0TWX5_9ZZZZ